MSDEWTADDDAAVERQAPIKSSAKMRYGGIAIGCMTFAALALSDDDKAFLRTQYTGKSASGMLYFFRMGERASDLLGLM